jgi:hypothetical protein
MNTFEHSSIGCAPSQIIFGYSVDLDRIILHPTKNKDLQAEDSPTYPEYVYKMLNLQAQVIARAQVIQETIANRHISNKLQFSTIVQYLERYHPVVVVSQFQLH